MANTQNYYYAVQTHYFQLDSDITAGLNSPTFNRNFRVLDATIFVTTAVAGATLTINRVRSGAVAQVAVFDVSGVGRAVITSDISQTNCLFESGDTMQLITSAGAGNLDANVIVYLQQFSV